MWKSIVAGLIALLFAATGCASGSSGNAEAAAERRDCAKQLSPLLDELSELNSRLDTGVPYAEYSTSVGDISVVYDDLDLDALGSECVQGAGIPLERAFNAYIAAGNAWDRCIDNEFCDLDFGSAADKMQDKWAKAADLIDEIDKKMESWEQAS